MWTERSLSSSVVSISQRLLQRTVKRCVHLPTGFVIFLSIAFVSLFICFVMLHSQEGLFEVRLPFNQTDVSGVWGSGYFDKLGRQSLTKTTLNSDVMTASQLLELLPLASRDVHQKERPRKLSDSEVSYSNHSSSSNSRLTISDWLWLQANRTAQMQEMCITVSPTMKNTDTARKCGLRLDGIFIDKSNRVLYCAVPKVASSSVKLALAFMTGRVNRTTSSDISYPVHANGWLRSVGIFSVDYLIDNESRWLKRAWSSLRKFLIVRDPIERLVSAYVDKFTLRNKFADYFQHRFGRRIVRLYRNGSSSSSSVESRLRRGARPPPPPPAPSGSRSSSTPARGRTEDGDSSDGHDVSFAEFVRFLVDRKVSCTHKSNPHWMSYFDLCHPCFIDYDYIIHYEYLADELGWMWRSLYNKSNLDQVLGKRNAGKTKSSDLLNHYISQLPSGYLNALRISYELDYRMFMYS